MEELVELWETPGPARYMVAGWRQWADAGAVSSGLPRYLVECTSAHKIGRIRPGPFYLFQIPGTHHLLRPVVKLSEGHREALSQRENEFYASGVAPGLVVFVGEEPHQSVHLYSEAFFDAVEALGVERVVGVAGVHAPIPFDKDREISCVYSLPRLKDELAQYPITFSNYEGGASIGTILADKAEDRGIEFVALYAFVPCYAFPAESLVAHRMAMDEDFKAWHDVLRILNRMFGLDFNLSDLQRRSEELVAVWDSKIDELARTMPRLRVEDYMEEVNKGFSEESLDRLDGVWGDALHDLFDDGEL